MLCALLLVCTGFFFSFFLLMYSPTFTFTLCTGLPCLLVPSWVRPMEVTYIRLEGNRKRRGLGFLYPCSLSASYCLAVVRALFWRPQQSSLLPSPNRGSLLIPGRPTQSGFQLSSSLWWWTLRWLSLIHSLPLITVPLLKQLWIPTQGWCLSIQDADSSIPQLLIGSKLGGERKALVGLSWTSEVWSPVLLCSAQMLTSSKKPFLIILIKPHCSSPRVLL